MSGSDLDTQRAFGASVREARRRGGLSLSEVASRVGISVATLSRVENGKQALDVTLLVLLCRAIGVSAAALSAFETNHDPEAWIVEALSRLPMKDFRAVLATAGARRLERATNAELMDVAIAGIDAAAETLRLLQRRIAQSRPRKPRSRG